MFKKVLFTAALLAVSAGAQAGIEINASKYFAYTVLPARGTSVQTVVVLSNQPCETKNAPRGAKKAALQDRYMERPACWDNYQDIILLCPATAERGQLGNACQNFSTERFIAVESLPKRAGF